jgi:hypothetical protein
MLVAAERNDRRAWADHRARLEIGVLPVTTAPVVAQVSRSPRQAQLRRFLRGCHVEDFGRDHAHEVGALLARTGGTDVVDAHLMLVATGTATGTSVVWTSDPEDLARLSDQLPNPCEIRRV